MYICTYIPSIHSAQILNYVMVAGGKKSPTHQQNSLVQLCSSYEKSLDRMKKERDITRTIKSLSVASPIEHKDKGASGLF